MPLNNIKLKLSYNSGEDNLTEEFYIPCFMNSIKYERAVGFFTSGVLTVISQGLNRFLLNEGSVRLICSPKLNEEDIEAIQKGYKDRDKMIAEAIVREIDKIPNEIINNNLNCLSWLIANGRLDIKIALPKNIDENSYGIYHEKIGVFYDKEGNIIAFSGSQNETLTGLTYNYESFDVYRSWAENERCSMKVDHFNKLWDNIAQGVEVYNFPDAAKKKIIEKVIPQTYSEVNGNYVYLTQGKKIDVKSFCNKLWYFQKEAIDSWKNNKFVGIFSMATGTGKTKTAIGGIIELKKLTKENFVIIACPQNTIIKQWEQEIDNLDIFKHSIIADGSNDKWENDLANSVIDYNDGNISDCVVYTTYNTLSSDKFIKVISDIKKETLLICDEVHWAGADTFREGLLSKYKYRLGLSATPSRYMDEEGTDKVNAYFEKVVFEFTLERALMEINPATGKTFLCPYNYYPIFVSLGEDELNKYYELTEKIKKQYAKEIDRKDKSEYFQRICEERQRIIVNAEAKDKALGELLDSLDIIKFLLVYCSPQQIDEAQEILNGRNIKNHRFTGVEGTNPRGEYNGLSERDYILKNFEEENLSALVAMRCLDEGINVVSAEVGIFLASSGNPRQFVQRRGRLLRRHENKSMAKIYDICVVPFLDKNSAKKATDVDKSILIKELNRYEEFASLADNKLEAMNLVFKIKEMYNFY
jgi:superfamily II DNA or RNA helicase